MLGLLRYVLLIGFALFLFVIVGLIRRDIE